MNVKQELQHKWHGNFKRRQLKLFHWRWLRLELRYSVQFILKLRLGRGNEFQFSCLSLNTLHKNCAENLSILSFSRNVFCSFSSSFDFNFQLMKLIALIHVHSLRNNRFSLKSNKAERSRAFKRWKYVYESFVYNTVKFMRSLTLTHICTLNRNIERIRFCIVVCLIVFKLIRCLLHYFVSTDYASLHIWCNRYTFCTFAQLNFDICS